MPEYLVTWQIDIDADNPKEACEKALRIMQDKESIATVFEVMDRDGELSIIDLTHGDENGNYVGDR